MLRGQFARQSRGVGVARGPAQQAILAGDSLANTQTDSAQEGGGFVAWDRGRGFRFIPFPPVQEGVQHGIGIAPFLSGRGLHRPVAVRLVLLPCFRFLGLLRGL